MKDIDESAILRRINRSPSDSWHPHTISDWIGAVLLCLLLGFVALANLAAIFICKTDWACYR